MEIKTFKAAHLRRLVVAALREDEAWRDVTSRAIPLSLRAVGEIVAEQSLVVSGMKAACLAFRLCDRGARISARFKDGMRVRAGSVLLRVTGRARGLLAAERTALNFLSHLSGIATLTRAFVDQIPRGCQTQILDTRKTVPLLRAVEKEAVRHGGGHNHRSTLAEAVLLKDNHVELAGGVGRAVIAARKVLGRSWPIEVEVSDLAGLSSAIASGADRVLLDNMTDVQIRRCVRFAAGRIWPKATSGAPGAGVSDAGRVAIEVSGGIGRSRIAKLARMGVDFISVGALTHSAPSARLSMDVRRR